MNWPLALATLIVGGVVWITLEKIARRDLAHAAETPAAATIRRIVRYGLAAIALAALLWGLTELLRIISSVTAGTVITDAAVRTQNQARFARAAALALVGAPAWWGFWWSQQSQTLTADSAASAARDAWPRRVYLYGIILAAAIAAFYSLGMLFYALIAGHALANAAVEWGPIGLVALLALAGHSLAHRADNRAISAEVRPPGDEPAPSMTDAADNRTPLATAAPAPSTMGPRSYVREALPPPTRTRPPIIVVIDGREGTLGAQLLAALRVALPGAIFWPMGLNAAAQGAMLDALGGAPVTAPADACARATLILGPSDILAAGGLAGEVSADLAAAIIASPARKLLLPPTDPALRWVAAPDWPTARWIENAVIEATNLMT